MPLISQLFVHPVKSCRGIEVARAPMQAWGLAHDRQWMIVDAQGQFLTQRELPALTRIVVSLPQARPAGAAAGSAPGRPAPGPSGLPEGAEATGLPTLEGLPDVPDLHLQWAGPDGQVAAQAAQCLVRPVDDLPARPVKVWRYEGQGIDCGDAVAEFLAACLGTPARLVRFPAEAERVCNPQWTGALHGITRFSDGYPVLLLGRASVADLATRLGAGPLAIERFRPNVVLDDLPAYEEDFIKTLASGPVDAPQALMQLVKPCPRCSIPRLDPRTGAPLPEDPTAQLALYRYHTAVEGAVLGMNALPLAVGAVLHKGQRLTPTYDF